MSQTLHGPNIFMLQVTRLCDLTNENDTVTSVSWAERGDKVAVGTHRGFVQVSAQSHTTQI